MNKLCNIIKNGCAVFTVITLLTYSVGALISGKDQEFIPSIRHIWLFFAFSLLLAFANRILASDKLSSAARLGFHFLSCGAIYFVTVILCGGYISNGAQTVVALSLFLVLYLIFTVIYLIRNGAKKKKETKKYEKMFK